MSVLFSRRPVGLDYRPALIARSPALRTHRGMGVTGTFDSTQVLRPLPRQMALRVIRHSMVAAIVLSSSILLFPIVRRALQRAGGVSDRLLM
jgi:hypothetical protein